MRHLVVFLVAILWAMPVQAETKKAPDGFGPIKFGMTKEEAWAAIDGKGEWEDDDTLIYELSDPHISVGPAKLTVKQKFKGGKAYMAQVDLAEFEKDYRVCASYAYFVVAYISDKYEKNPIYSNVYRGNLPDKSYIDYVFYFSGHALVIISWAYTINEASATLSKTCWVHAFYADISNVDEGVIPY